eukprot:23752-Rhodomonas_salina.3
MRRHEHSRVIDSRVTEAPSCAAPVHRSRCLCLLFAQLAIGLAPGSAGSITGGASGASRQMVELTGRPDSAASTEAARRRSECTIRSVSTGLA